MAGVMRESFTRKNSLSTEAGKVSQAVREHKAGRDRESSSSTALSVFASNLAVSRKSQPKTFLHHVVRISEQRVRKLDDIREEHL